ncbi:hypothetical protein M1146_08155 [Patescibacteria group bacterium]|nr:hypothetical protein [Patescibacteria group bacterium]
MGNLLGAGLGLVGARVGVLVGAELVGAGVGVLVGTELVGAGVGVLVGAELVGTGDPNDRQKKRATKMEEIILRISKKKILLKSSTPARVFSQSELQLVIVV